MRPSSINFLCNEFISLLPSALPSATPCFLASLLSSLNSNSMYIYSFLHFLLSLIRFTSFSSIAEKLLSVNSPLIHFKNSFKSLLISPLVPLEFKKIVVVPSFICKNIFIISFFKQIKGANKDNITMI